MTLMPNFLIAFIRRNEPCLRRDTLRCADFNLLSDFRKYFEC